MQRLWNIILRFYDISKHILNYYLVPTPTSIHLGDKYSPARLPKIHLELGLQAQYERLHVSYEGLCHVMEAGYSHVHLQSYGLTYDSGKQDLMIAYQSCQRHLHTSYHVTSRDTNQYYNIKPTYHPKLNQLVSLMNFY